jgi:hypothetical protein
MSRKTELFIITAVRVSNRMKSQLFTVINTYSSWKRSRHFLGNSPRRLLNSRTIHSRDRLFAVWLGYVHEPDSACSVVQLHRFSWALLMVYEGAAQSKFWSFGNPRVWEWSNKAERTSKYVCLIHLLFKILCFGDWILSPSSGET